MDDREDRIRRRAHALWEQEGRPHGRHDDHWQAAHAEHVADDGAPLEARSLGSAAQSDLIPEDAGTGSDRPGSLVDTGPALGLAAGMGSTGGAVGALGNLSLGSEEPGGVAAIAPAPAKGRRTKAK